MNKMEPPAKKLRADEIKILENIRNVGSLIFQYERDKRILEGFFHNLKYCDDGNCFYDAADYDELQRIMAKYTMIFYVVYDVRATTRGNYAVSWQLHTAEEIKDLYVDIDLVKYKKLLIGEDVIFSLNEKYDESDSDEDINNIESSNYMDCPIFDENPNLVPISSAMLVTCVKFINAGFKA